MLGAHHGDGAIACFSGWEQTLEDVESILYHMYFKTSQELFRNICVSSARLLHARVPSCISCFFSKMVVPLPLLYFILAWQIHLLSFMANSTSSVKDPRLTDIEFLHSRSHGALHTSQRC